jgi:putative methionine-R-sulfoxide reductase with GAF domain
VGFETKSILATPLMIKEEIIGVLEIINKNDKGYFDDDDRLWLEIFLNPSGHCLSECSSVEKREG